MGSASHRHVSRLGVGAHVEVKHGFLWLHKGTGIVRSTYVKEGREFAIVQLDGTGKVVLRLVKTLRAIGDR